MVETCQSTHQVISGNIIFFPIGVNQILLKQYPPPPLEHSKFNNDITIKAGKSAESLTRGDGTWALPKIRKPRVSSPLRACDCTWIRQNKCFIVRCSKNFTIIRRYSDVHPCCTRRSNTATMGRVCQCGGIITVQTQRLSQFNYNSSAQRQLHHGRLDLNRKAQNVCPNR